MSYTIEQLKDMQSVVKTLLTKHAAYRDNDRKLVAHVWMIQIGGIDKMKEANLWDFMHTWVNNENLAMPDTITRARRKVQEEFPSLRGEKYTQRHSEGIDVRNAINCL